MPIDSTTLAYLRSEFKKLRRDWSTVAEEYHDDDPVCSSPQEWDELKHQDLTVRSAIGESFKQAWSDVRIAAGNLFCLEFAEWSAKVLNASDHDLAATCPDPINPSRDQGYYGAEQQATLSLVLTGARDTVEAGKRMIFWAAACHTAEHFRRPRAFVEIVLRWTECLAVFGGGQCTLLDEPLEWIDAALDVLTAESTASGGEAGDEFPDELYKDPEGNWLTPKWMTERYDIPNSRLSEWRGRCPRLRGRILRAKIKTNCADGNHEYVYFWMDVEKLANIFANEKQQAEELLELRNLRKQPVAKRPNSGQT